MQHRRLSLVTIVSSVVAVVIVGILTVGGGTAAAPGGRAATERDAKGEGAKGGSSEAEEEGQLTQERLDAWRAAKRPARSACKQPRPAPAAGLGRRAGDQPDGRRLGTGDRRRPQFAVRLPADNALLRPDRVREPMPAAVHHAQGLERRRRDVGARPLHLHVPGRQLAVRTRISRSCRTPAPSTRHA